MRICFVASEVAPLAKTGGLADVAGVLPRHLHDQGHDIRVVMPLYSSIGTAALEMMPVEGAQHVELRLGAHLYHYSLYETRLPGSAVPLYFVHCPAVYDRATIYTIGPDEHLRFLVLELRAGRARKDAWSAFADRIGIDDARALATMLRQAEEMGTSLGETLSVFSADMRSKRMLRAEEKALALSAKLTVPLILFIFPALLGVLMLPAAARLFQVFGHGTRGG